MKKKTLHINGTLYGESITFMAEKGAKETLDSLFVDCAQTEQALVSSAPHCNDTSRTSKWCR